MLESQGTAVHVYIDIREKRTAPKKSFAVEFVSVALPRWCQNFLSAREEKCFVCLIYLKIVIVNATNRYQLCFLASRRL